MVMSLPRTVPASTSAGHRKILARCCLHETHQQQWQPQQQWTQRQGLPHLTRRHRPPCSSVCLAASYNPQNVDNPLVLPRPEFTAEQAVAAQLEALQRNDEPWDNHGIKTLYAFAFDVGGLEPSMYFGFPKDLYHEDHFQGMFATRLPELVNNMGFQVTDVQDQPGKPDSPPTTVVRVQVQAATAQQPSEFEFQLRRKAVGARKGCLMTWAILNCSTIT